MIYLNKKNSLILKLIVILFIAFMVFLIYTKIKEDHDPQKILEEQKQAIFSKIDKTNSVNVSKYSIYGTHFNVEGTLDIIKISGITVDYVDLVIKDLTGNETVIKSDFSYSENTLSFSTFDKINDGIDLESLSISSHYILLKVTYSNSDVKYYPLNNSSKYGNLTYYTITRNGSNNKINISFDKYNDIPYMSIEVTKTDSLPEDVYDIAIDPGHGGLDKGAVSKDKQYKESEIVLDYSLKLKSELENLGLKVFISRDGSEGSKVDTTRNMYDDNGRINLLNGSNAKLILSMHINETNYSKENGGLEIYTPNNCDTTFAELLAKNIVEMANTYYSNLNSFKKADGVYFRGFTNAEIAAYDNKAAKGGYEKYNLSTSTPYLYTIRETGGISTNAFVDGRNLSYGTNKYCYSNIGIETYQLELGYMIIPKDVENILNNQENYIKAIVESVKTHYKL